MGMGMEMEGLRLRVRLRLRLRLRIVDCGLRVACSSTSFIALCPVAPLRIRPDLQQGRERKVYSTRFGHGVFLGKTHPLCD